MLLVSYIQQYFNTSKYFHHSSDKLSLKVTDCTVQSAEYYGAFTVQFLILLNNE